MSGLFTPSSLPVAAGPPSIRDMNLRKWPRSLLALAAVGALSVSVAGAVPAAGSAPDSESDGYTFAVIGDIPYGDTQIANFPKVIAQINADRAVRWVNHLGHVKNGSTVCSEAYFQMI